MKNRVLSLLLIISLMISMLVVLTACGDGEEEKTSKSENSSSSDTDSDVEELAQNVEDAINDGDFDKLEDYFEEDAFIANTMLMLTYKANLHVSLPEDDDEDDTGENEISFDELYEFVKDAKKDSASKVVKKYSDLLDKLNDGEEYSESELEEQVEEFVDQIDYFMDNYIEQLEYVFNSLDSYEVSIKKIGKLEKIDGDNCYKVNVKASMSAEYDGDKKSEEGSDTFYVMKVDGEYKIYGSEEWLLGATYYSSNGVLTQAQNAVEKTEVVLVNETVEIAIANLQADFLVSSARPADATFADYLTYEMLDEKLKEEGYRICTKTSADGTIKDMSKSVVGVIYITEIGDSDEIIYEITIEKDGQTRVKVTNVEKVN